MMTTIAYTLATLIFVLMINDVVFYTITVKACCLYFTFYASLEKKGKLYFYISYAYVCEDTNATKKMAV